MLAALSELAGDGYAQTMSICYHRFVYAIADLHGLADKS